MSENHLRLNRRLGYFPVYNIVVANIIGAGIFTTSGIILGEINHTAIMILIWLFGGLIAISGALSYSELGIAMPQAGGEYTFLSRLFHPSIGFLSGWVSFIAGFSAPIAASAIGFSEYFYRAIPLIPNTGHWSNVSPESAKQFLAISVIILFTAIHARGLSFGSRIQNFLTVMKIALLVLLILGGLFLGKGDWSHFSNNEPFIANLSGMKAGGLSLLWVMFAYSGWNAATYIGSEVKNPRKNIPKALITGTLTVVALYFLLNVFFVYAIPPDQMKGVVSVGGLAVANAFGVKAESIISLLISFALFSSLSAYLILGPRVYYAMSRDGYFFRSIARVTSRNHAPSRAILLQGALSIVMVVSGTFDQILTYMGFALGLFPLLAVAGIFKLRKGNPTAPSMPGYPWVQIFFLTTSAGILTLSFIERPSESFIALITVLLGLPVYFYFREKSKKENQNRTS
ncbi:MAG TPA: amino acid permease [Prolixibacteraceae bacterium]|nr:amino acid permease [Prolixibacteraceae bacterium]